MAGQVILTAMAESTFLNPAKAVRAAHIDEGMHVADLGSGSGFFARAAAREVGDRGVVWAVDAHRDMLPRIKNFALGEGLRNVEVLHGNLEKVCGSNLPAEQFDYVIAANLFFSIEHKKILVEEISRVLKRGGKALIIDWKDSFGGLGPHPTHVASSEQIRELFEASGFIFQSEIPAGEYHWGFIVRKKPAKAAQLN